MDELAHLGPQVAMVLHYLHERPLLFFSINKPNYHIVVSMILLSKALGKFLSNSPFLIFPFIFYGTVFLKQISLQKFPFPTQIRFWKSSFKIQRG